MIMDYDRMLPGKTSVAYLKGKVIASAYHGNDLKIAFTDNTSIVISFEDGEVHIKYDNKYRCVYDDHDNHHSIFD